MEVSRQSDSVTHAVIGNKESARMGVANSATLMHVLSTALYTHPKLAAVREICCNGWDGHIISGNTEIPLEITLDDQFMTIRDFGPGIAHEKIGEIYGTYGASTKLHDGEQTGGFGLGSKAPFAYTDNFEVTSCHGGQKTIYRVSKSSMAAGGSPTIDTIVKLPTEETGITVKVNVKSGHDRGEFNGIIREVIMLGGIQAKLNGVLLPTLPVHESPTGYIVSDVQGTILDRINVRYGNVVYPVPRLAAYSDIYQSIQTALNSLWEGAKVIFMAEPNTITIAPSREALIFSEETVKAVNALLGKFDPTRVKVSKDTAKQIGRRQINELIPMERLYRPGELARQVQLPPVPQISKEVAQFVYDFDARRAAVGYAVSRRERLIDGKHLVIRRMKNAIYHGLVDKVRGKRFIQASKKHEYWVNNRLKRFSGSHKESYLRKALHKEITWPLIEQVRAHDFMDEERLHYVNDKHWDNKLCSPWKYEVCDPQSLFAFVKPKVLLARSKTAIRDFITERKYKEPGYEMAGWIVYQLPIRENNYEVISEVFSNLGYEVHTYLPTAKVVERSKPSDDPNWVPAPKKMTPKRKGYLTLASSYDGETFTLVHARASCKPDAHVLDPIAYVVLSSGTGWERKRFADIRDVLICEAINEIFGHQIAVVTTNQIEKLSKKGIPELSAFIFRHVDDTLAASQEFRRYLAFGQYLYSYTRDSGSPEAMLMNLTQHEDLAKSLTGKPFRFCVSAQIQAMAQILHADNIRNCNLPKCQELAKKVKRSTVINDMLRQIKESPWYGFVNMSAVNLALSRRVPNDPALEIPYQIVTHLLTPTEKNQ